MKIEQGVLVMKDGKAWGVEYADGHCTVYGWIAPEDAPLHDPRYCKKPTDVVARGDTFNAQKLQGAVLVPVKRKTTVEIIEMDV